MAWVKAYEKAGLVHLLPGTRRRPLLLLSPRFTDRPQDFAEALVLEALRETTPGCRFYYWRTGRVRVIPLIADTGAERIGFCISRTPSPQRRQWLPLLIAQKRGEIDRAFLLFEDGYARVQEGGVFDLPTHALLGDLRGWIARRTHAEARKEMAQINRARHARLAPWARPR